MCLVLKVLFILAFVLSVYAPCPSGYTNYRRQSCFTFKYFDSETITVEEAEEICKNDSNGLLASIDDQRQEKFLTDVFMYDPAAHYTVWIGLKRNPKDLEQFIWGDGNNSTYRHWEPGEPNMFKGDPEYCVHFDVKTVNGQKHNGWNDEPCDSNQVYGVLCRAPYETLSDIEKKYSAEIKPVDSGSKTGIAIGATIGVFILLAFIAFVAYIGFRKWKNSCPTIPMVQLKNEPV